MHRKLKAYITRQWTVKLWGRRRASSAITLALIVTVVVMVMILHMARQPVDPPLSDGNFAAHSDPVLPAIEVNKVREERNLKSEDTPAALCRPVPGDCLAGYGWRWSPILREWRLHPGCDLQASPGDNVIAIADGIVQETGLTVAGANMVRINHGDIGEVSYGNLETLFVESGQKVHGGQIIGTVSSVMVCHDDVGAHLHIEWRLDGHIVDPKLRLPE